MLYRVGAFSAALHVVLIVVPVVLLLRGAAALALRWGGDPAPHRPERGGARDRTGVFRGTGLPAIAVFLAFYAALEGPDGGLARSAPWLAPVPRSSSSLHTGLLCLSGKYEDAPTET